MAISWNDDDPHDAARIGTNARRVLEEIVAQRYARTSPTVAQAQQWHRDTFQGCTLPVPYYAGEVRDTDSQFPELIGYEVVVGRNPGVPSVDVPDHLERFEHAAQQAATAIDRIVPVGSTPGTAPDLRSAAELASVLHGEWVRVHPFANGNGRIARLWANWTLVRYGLPAVVRAVPRPAASAYATAASQSMLGNHDLMTVMIIGMVRRAVSP